MSFVKIWVHLVFSTYNRNPLLAKDVRRELLSHVRRNCKEKNIFLQSVNGYTEHLHCLVSLRCDQTIAQVAQLIKGESAHWLNNNHFKDGLFAWQDDYFAVSVSESMVKTVMAYIKNQEAHHATKPFSDEYHEFLCKYGFDAYSKK
jgi:putative transposase